MKKTRTVVFAKNRQVLFSKEGIRLILVFGLGLLINLFLNTVGDWGML